MTSVPRAVPSAVPSAVASGRLTTGLALAASVGLLVALAAVRYLPTHDGPQHVFLAHLENHFSDPGATYSDFYEPTTALTSKGFSLVYGPLAELMPWRSALQITLGIIVLTWAWGVFAFVGAVSPRRRLLGLMGFALAFQWALYMGFFSYLLSTGVGFFTLAVAFGAKEWPWKRRVAIGALLLAQALCHVFAAEVVGLTLVVLVLCRRPRSAWIRELGLLAIVGLPTALIGIHAAGWIGSTAAELPYSQAERVWPALAVRVELLASAFAAGPWWRAWPPVLLALAGVVFGVRRTVKKLTSSDERALLIMATLLGLAALAFPLHSRSWEFMSVRFIPMGVVFGLALVPIEALERRAALLVQGAVIVLTASAIAWAGWHNKRLETACGPALEGLDADLKRTGPRLPVVLDPSCNALSEKKVFVLPGNEPLLNLGALYAVQQGGVVPYAFVGIPQLHGFVVTREGNRRFPDVPDRKTFWGGLAQSDPVADAAFRRGLLTSLARSGSRYEDVIFYGPPPDRTQLSQKGYVTDFARDGLWIGHYRGCPLVIEVGNASARTAPLLVHYGWLSSAEPAESRVVPPGEGLVDGSVRVEWATAPCGALWVRAGIDGDGSGKWKPSSGKCEGAGEDGRLVLPRTVGAGPGAGAAERCVLRVP
jgi:hypothetical protein